MLAITSKNERLKRPRYGNTQLRYAMVYVCITFVVLVFLNIYTAGNSQKIFYQNKQTAMVEKCLLTSSKIAGLDVINETSVSTAVRELGNLRVSRLIITDPAGVAIYDSYTEDSQLGHYVFFPEIIRAMDGTDVFSWHYQDGAMQSRAATPIVSYGRLVGCVYMMENDAQKGALMYSLQSNILTITLILEVLIILFSVIFSTAFSRRFHRILTSMRIIREGDYTHKVTMGGRDELTFLGDEFNDLTDRLQNSEGKRRQFVSDASHELKTPLASIKLLTDSILQNDMDMETVREFVGDIGNEADRLTRMTEKLLSLTKKEGQAEQEYEITNVAPTIQKVMRMLSGIASQNQITMHVEIQADSPILILEDDLYQIIFNLIENGIKYNMAGGTLSVKLFRQEENAVLQISDTGVGIPENALTHIFERFYRVDKARSRKTGGSGLGLAIVKTMVERNHGQITVDSKVGKGTTFTVSFPIFDTEEVSP